MPTAERISETLEIIGMEKTLIDLHRKLVFLKESGMQISFAAIGKGYAADRVKAIWVRAGVKSGIINASGDISFIGYGQNALPWQIGIPMPGNKDNMLLQIQLSNGAIATSGDYEQYFTWKGTRYSHTLNPCTGFPVSNMQSVSVISPSAELSDALATGLTVMPPDAGIHLIDQLPDTHCLIVNHNGRVYQSSDVNMVLV